MDKRCYANFHVLPSSYSEYVLFIKYGDDLRFRTIASVGELLPFTKREYVSNLDLDYSIGFIDGHTNEKVILQQIPYSKSAHKNEIILSVDENYFPQIQIKPIIMNEICVFPEILDKNWKSKIPVIGFYDFFSVICYHNFDKNQYEFIKAWNGKFGKPLFVSFDKEKPSYGELAVESYRKNPKFVVSDLINILSEDPKNIADNDTWGFTITEDSENDVLLEFETFEGETKFATPTFLMALLLKEHLKEIKVETGKKPEVIGFYFFDKFDSEAAKQRIKEGLEGACKLLKTDCKMLNF